MTGTVTESRPTTTQMPQGEPAPATREFKTHNHLLGDFAALDRAWEEDGYWFFRDVLDKDAVGRLRAIFVAELVRLGVADDPGTGSTAGSVQYNGTSLAQYPHRMEPLAAREPWRAFVAEKPIEAFFTRLFGDEPFWVPVVEYRAIPPQQDPARARLDGIQQDGPYSPGLPFRICWIPLAEIDEDIGGLIAAEGFTEQVNRHPIDAGGSNTMIPVSALPQDCWRRATYQAGDVLLMNLWSPHSGLSNVSNRFRLSLDHRVMAKRDKCPIVGEVVAATPDQVTVRDENGTTTLRIQPETYVRNHMGQKLSGSQITDYYTPGARVIIAHDGDLATVVRPPH